MSSERHLDPADVHAFLRGAAPRERVLAIGRHLSECEVCRASAQGLDDSHLHAERELFPYVDGTTDEALRERVESHLANCDACRGDAEDLGLFAASMRKRRNVVPYAIAAAAVLVLVALLVAPMVHRDEQPHSARRAAVDPLALGGRALVDEALRQGIDQPPILRELAPRHGTLRGSAGEPSVTLSPRATVVEETRPLFAWTPVAGGRYQVLLFDSTRQITASAELQTTSWRCDVELSRGRDYSWSLQAGETLLPPPTEGPARFRVADAATAQELAAARAKHPHDHLLLGVLYARGGMRDDARRELRQVAQSDPRMQRLLADLAR